MPEPVQTVDVSAVVEAGAPGRVRWSASNQLHTNLVVLGPGEAIAPHVEAELDVTLVVLAGSADLQHGPDDAVTTVAAPSLVVLPAGTRRSVTAGPAGVTYVTAHRARGGLLPRRV